MLLVIHDGIRADPGELRALVLEGFRGVGKDGVEVHVVPHGGRVSFHGRAWPEVPPNRAFDPRTRFLVELTMPRRPSDRGFPFEWKYPRLKTAPPMVARTWQERLVAVVAHEACHVRQFRSGKRRSEVAAERWAKRALERYAKAR